jgi:FAD/FMN-containing dehydrogenase/Fe-S oxidoreductase
MDKFVTNKNNFSPNMWKDIQIIFDKINHIEHNFDELHRLIYSTDASDYSEKPLGVVYPKNIEEVQQIILLANDNGISLIPRGGGTSLAGQVVGNGLVVDISKYFNQILEINQEESWVRVEPGVIPDVLNLKLKEYSLFWGPETSTSNRNTLGGMVGNNSCGSHFPLYGNTRDHILEVKGFFADGSEFHFKPLTKLEIEEILKNNSKESKIYNFFLNSLADKSFQQTITDNFPKESIMRRNSGYAVDSLMKTKLFDNSEELFNLSKLIAGSEGTLVFITEIKLNLVPLPPPNVGVVAVHFSSLKEALEANIIAMKHFPGAVELTDDNVLELTKENLTQAKNRFFIEGSPAAILVIEFAKETESELDACLNGVIEDLKANGTGYYFPIIKGKQISQIWELRKAGLGLLANIKGNERSVTVIEDTALDIHDLPAFTEELTVKMTELGTRLITYAHVATGELHFHPILNLHTEEGVRKYREVLFETAKLVKKYRGSLCGEHGDGRLRGEMIPFMFGEEIYNYFRQIKELFDPKGIFNPGKIIDAPPMNTFLRIDYKKPKPEINTYFNFSNDGGFPHSIEKCNGSGDCRKPQILGGTMCPSYKATLNEKDTTRARANALREVIINSPKGNPFANEDLLEVFSLCLSCKACKSECPSNVDVTKLKAEFLQHYYDANGTPLKAWLVGNITKLNKLGSLLPDVYNFFVSNKLTTWFIKSILGFEQNRQLPLLQKQTLKNWHKKNLKRTAERKVYLFADEFTNFNDSEIGIKAILLLEKLGYEVQIPKISESGRTYLSKGLLKQAKKVAEKNVTYLSTIISKDSPLIGIEPSAILTFRDEYQDLVSDNLIESAQKLAQNCFLIDEFLANEFEKGNISSDLFTDIPAKLLLHTHCHQKALASSESLIKALTIPINYKVEEIKSGCCGMAGSFGFEKEKYEVSMAIGELVLFPAVRDADDGIIIVASGTSCRHQITDGTEKKALHPVEVLFRALGLSV